MRYPPFCDIILLGINGRTKEEVENTAKNIFNTINIYKEKNNIEMNVFKPVPAPIDRIKNKIRWRIIIKCKLNEKIIVLLNEVLQKANKEISKNKNNQTKIICDINPNNMM